MIHAINTRSINRKDSFQSKNLKTFLIFILKTREHIKMERNLNDELTRDEKGMKNIGFEFRSTS